MVNITNNLAQHLPRYEIKNRLGAGGMATVYRALDKNLNRDVAIKVLHEHLVYDDTFKERFEQEAHFIAGFNHPNIIQMFDFDTIDLDAGKIYYMVMPYLSGETLADVLDDCRAEGVTLTHERIKAIVSDLADALDYAHARGMVHRDVKPANILFDENNRAILTDFGIARLAQSSGLTADGTIIGTPAYMSPEQATGNETDYRSDIYSLGIIIFELLTGKPPFDDESTVSLLLKHVQAPPPSVSAYLDDMNERLDVVLQKVLAKQPAQRYQSARALKLALEEAINQETPQQRLEPHMLKSVQASGKQPDTKIFEDEPYPEKADLGNTITRTIQTLMLKPAKQNPLGFTALAIAIIALLLIARMAQSPATIATPEPDTAGVDSMAGDYSFFSTQFDDENPVNEYWQQSSTGIVLRSIENGQYRIQNTQAGLAVTSLYSPSMFSYNDAMITMDGQILESSANDSTALGIVFRYQDDDNYYVFGVDGEGSYSIWIRADGQWCELRNSCNDGTASSNWEIHEAINPIGETNTLRLNLSGSQITGYVNDAMVFLLDDDTFTSGGIGIYMATTRFGEGEVLIDSYAVSDDVSGADSMTDDTDSMTDE